jgi:hypothetical protein
MSRLLQTRRWTCPCRCCRGCSSRIPLLLPAAVTLTSASPSPESLCLPRHPQPAICWTRYVTTPAPPFSNPRPNRALRGARGRSSRAKCVARLSTGLRCSRDTCAHTQVGPGLPFFPFSASFLLYPIHHCSLLS